MFSAVRRCTLSLALSVCFTLPVFSQPIHPGDIASEQTRHIATLFPGRMTGSPAEMLAADYLRQQFVRMGYQSDIRAFHSRYIYTAGNHRTNWQNVTGSTVIAAHEGTAPQQIIVMAHLDTYAPLTDADVDNNLGGLTLQGVDDNAAGIGVMLELEERLKDVPTRYGVRFIATSGEEEGGMGAENLLKRMSALEKKQTLLVINLSHLVAGDKLAFTSGKSTPAAVRQLTRDSALKLARRFGIPVSASSVTPADNDAVAFDNAGIPVLSITAVNDPARHRGRHDVGPVAHNARQDNLQYLEQTLPGRLDKRCRDVMRVLLPLVKTLAKAGK
ncbi:aminopeptidase [Cronobacter dublinensis]|uniref:aminopeptidase n=1 Tax=Cronobacter dublinensis TaxID=413497 RepID=UPI0024AF175B|nr:aminopeptidase [Cronobacter dublinensis]MDI7503640.1 aminopeptidase [Cronobacter dublinensis]